MQNTRVGPGEAGLEDQSGDGTSAAEQTYAAAGAATLALLGGLVGVLIGWIMGSTPRSIPGQGTLASADLLSTTLVAGLFGVGLGALVGTLWGLNIRRDIQSPVLAHEHDDHAERVVPLDYAPLAPVREPVLSGRGFSPDEQTPLAQTVTPYRNVMKEQGEMAQGDGTEDHNVVAVTRPDEEVAMDDRQRGRNADNVTGTEGAFDPETGAYGTAGTPVTTGYGVSGSTIGTGSSQVRDEHETGDFAGSTPDSASYEMGGRGSDDTPTPARADDSSDTPVTEKHGNSMATEAPAQTEPRTQDVYEASDDYGPGAAKGEASHTRTHAPNESIRSESSHNSDASLDVPPPSRAINSAETDASAGTNIAGTADPRGLGDNTDET